MTAGVTPVVARQLNLAGTPTIHAAPGPQVRVQEPGAGFRPPLPNGRPGAPGGPGIRPGAADAVRPGASMPPHNGMPAGAAPDILNPGAPGAGMRNGGMRAPGLPPETTHNPASPVAHPQMEPGQPHAAPHPGEPFVPVAPARPPSAPAAPHPFEPRPGSVNLPHPEVTAPRPVPEIAHPQPPHIAPEVRPTPPEPQHFERPAERPVERPVERPMEHPAAPSSQMEPRQVEPRQMEPRMAPPPHMEPRVAPQPHMEAPHPAPAQGGGHERRPGQP
jgi:hypothetical protein